VCVLIPAADASMLARERLAVMAGTDDGFKIAEEDLRLRGPGEMWGVRQSGIPRFRMADLARDEALLVQARDEAAAITAADPQLLRPEHAALRRALLENYREPLDLALAG
jgi:ATP-dependent DNA helicase RecG